MEGNQKSCGQQMTDRKLEWRKEFLLAAKKSEKSPDPTGTGNYFRKTGQKWHIFSRSRPPLECKETKPAKSKEKALICNKSVLFSGCRDRIFLFVYTSRTTPEKTISRSTPHMSRCSRRRRTGSILRRTIARRCKGCETEANPKEQMHKRYSPVCPLVLL